jgi:hypothetical protein
MMKNNIMVLVDRDHTPGVNPMLEDEEVLEKIKQSILDGNDLKETAKVCDINEGTLYQYHSHNVSSIADKIQTWKHERMLRKAEKNIEELQDEEDKRIKLDANKFVLETLGKKKYSKKQEVEHSGGINKVVEFKLVLDENNTDDKTNEETSVGVEETAG